MQELDESDFPDISKQIRVIRGQRVLLDADLALLYGVRTHRFNEAVKRNQDRFPPDFVFRLTKEEHATLISQSAISKPARGGRRTPPLAFTEHGAIMAATILNSPTAVEMSVYVVRAFVHLRQMLASNVELTHRLKALEKSVASLSASTRDEFSRVYKAILKLMGPSPPEQ